MSVLGNVVSGLFGAGTAAMNNLYAEQRERSARAENYIYGERAANNADQRTRALYADLYSPQAQMNQIKEAGLSPSIYYGDMAGISGQAGAQGTGASGVNPNIFGLDPMTLAQVNLMGAQTEKVKAETEKTTKETELTQENINNVIADTKNKYLEGENRVIQNMFAQIQYAIESNYAQGKTEKELEYLGLKTQNLMEELRKTRVDGNIAEATEETIIKFYQNRTLTLAKDILLKTQMSEKIKKEVEDLSSQIFTREKLATIKKEEIDNYLKVELQKIGISEGELKNDSWRTRLEMIKTAWQIAKDLGIMSL